MALARYLLWNWVICRQSLTEKPWTLLQPQTPLGNRSSNSLLGKTARSRVATRLEKKKHKCYALVSQKWITQKCASSHLCVRVWATRLLPQTIWLHSCSSLHRQLCSLLKSLTEKLYWFWLWTANYHKIKQNQGVGIQMAHPNGRQAGICWELDHLHHLVSQSESVKMCQSSARLYSTI